MGDYEMAHDGIGASKIGLKMWEKIITTLLGLHVYKAVTIHQFWVKLLHLTYLQLGYFILPEQIYPLPNKMGHESHDISIFPYRAVTSRIL
jgi:hypothetical protein